MPVDYLQLLPQAKLLGEAEIARQRRKQELLVNAIQALRRQAKNPDVLTKKVESRLAQTRSLPRCALPFCEVPDTIFSSPASSNSRPILAADGSQINPDRHEALSLALINISIITLLPGSGKAPVERVITELEIPEEDESGLTEALLALQRDAKERVQLADAAAALPGCIALTDGPLELFHQPQQARAFEQAFEDYLYALRRMQSNHTIPAGYVDKPRSSLVTRMLELSGDEAAAGLSILDDATLFIALLESGQRSAIFRMISEPGKRYNEALALHCFFVNVSQRGKPWIARVEMPQWVAADASAVNDLHSVVLEQCQLSGSRPYPYLLHRAHETALVSFQEKDEIQRLACGQVLAQGGTLEDISSKQSLKNLTGRTRHTP